MNLNQAKTPILEVGGANFETEVLKAERPVLVAFCAPWSRPCQILDGALMEVAVACGDTVKVVKVNADFDPDLSLWYEIQSVPTLVYFVAGNLRAKLVGTASKEAILSKLQAVLNGSPITPPAPELKSDNHHN